MPTINVSSAKLAVVFKPGELPSIDPADPQFVLDLSGVKIVGHVSAKAARKLAQHEGGAVLQGRLVSQNGRLVLADAGFSWLDAKPVETEVIQPAADFANRPR